MELVHYCKLYLHTSCCKWNNYQDQMCPEVREREECTRWLSKRENVTMPSINAACLSSEELGWEAGKTEAMLALRLCRVPIHSSDWASDGEQKTEAIQGNHRSRSTDCPWQVLSDSACPTEAHSHPQKCRIAQTMTQSVRFGSVKWITTSKSKHCYHTLKLAIRKVFAALWHKTTNSSVKCRKETDPFQWLSDYCTTGQNLRL